MIMEQWCRQHLNRYMSDFVWQFVHDDKEESLARWGGFRVRDFVKAETGQSYDSSTPIYRRARTKLDRAVRNGELVDYRPGNGGYTFYWPKGLAAKLRAELTTHSH